ALGANFGYELPWATGANSDVRAVRGKFISNVTAGANSVTLVTPSDHTLFNVGEFVMIAGLDIQMYGYPPNFDRFDFVKITAKNTTTGVITFINNTLRYDY
ncbi:MAG: hypothetical protein M3R04_07805, partial [bacterium]|nr:hypothetical protein [bacterium]